MECRILGVIYNATEEGGGGYGKKYYRKYYRKYYKSGAYAASDKKTKSTDTVN